MSRKPSIDPLISASHSGILTNFESESLTRTESASVFPPEFNRKETIRRGINKDLFFFFSFTQESSTLLLLQAFSVHFLGMTTLLLLGISSFSYFMTQVILLRGAFIFERHIINLKNNDRSFFSDLKTRLVVFIRALGMTLISALNLILLGTALYYFHETEMMIINGSPFLGFSFHDNHKILFLVLAILAFLAIRILIGPVTLFRFISRINPKVTENMLANAEHKIQASFSLLLYTFFFSFYSALNSFDPLLVNLLVLTLSYALSYLDNRVLIRGLEM